MHSPCTQAARDVCIDQLFAVFVVKGGRNDLQSIVTCFFAQSPQFPNESNGDGIQCFCRGYRASAEVGVSLA